MAKLTMKYLLVIGLILWSAFAFSSQEHWYEWESIIYKTYLHELKKKAVLTASMKYSDEHGHGVLHSLDLRVGTKRFVFPEQIIQEYGLIHPNSFRISAGDFTDEEEKRWVTVYFQYGLHPNIKEGSISFLNGKYRLRSIQEEP